MRNQVWFAVIVCVVAVLPCFFFGGVIAIFYRALIYWQVGPSPDFFFARALFGIDAPGKIIEWVTMQALPQTVQGFIGGAGAVLITSKLYKGGNIEGAAYSAGTLYTGLFLVASVVLVLHDGFRLTQAEAAAQLIGMWIGLLTTAENVSKPSPQSV